MGVRARGLGSALVVGACCLVVACGSTQAVKTKEPSARDRARTFAIKACGIEAPSLKTDADAYTAQFSPAVDPLESLTALHDTLTEAAINATAAYQLDGTWSRLATTLTTKASVVGVFLSLRADPPAGSFWDAFDPKILEDFHKNDEALTIACKALARQ